MTEQQLGVPASPSATPFRVREALASEPLGALLSESLKDLRRSGPMAWALAQREISGEVRRTSLWWVGTVVSVLTLTALATAMRGAGVLTVSESTMPYPVFVMLGAVVWTTFLDALQAPIRGLRTEAAFLVETTSSVESVLLASLGPVMLRLLAKVVVLGMAMAWFGCLPALTFPLAAAPLGLALLLGFAIGLSLAPLSLLFTEIPTMIDSSSVVLFLITPVCFTPPPGLVGRLMTFNPLGALMTTTRELCTIGWPAFDVPLIMAAVLPALALIAGSVVCRLALPVVLEHARG